MARVANAVRTVVDDLRGAGAKAQIPRFLELKRKITDLTADQKKIQKDIVDWLRDDVEADADGHHEYVLDEPIEGYKSLKLIRAVSTGKDEDAIQEILEERGLLEQCTVTVTAFDEDAIAQAVLDGLLSDEDVARMFPQKVQYRLTTPKA